MKSKILAGAIALALMLTPTVASYASENINDKEVYLECDDCIKDNDIEITLCGVASGKCGFHTLRAFSPLIPMVCRLFRYSKVYIVP